MENKPKSFLGSLVLTLFFGPLGLFYVSFWGGIVMLLLPAAFSIFIAYQFLDNNILLLRHYPMTLAIWGSIYWFLCILCTCSLVLEYNSKIRELSRTEDREDKPHHLKRWLLENPGKTVNDYYATLLYS